MGLATQSFTEEQRIALKELNRRRKALNPEQLIALDELNRRFSQPTTAQPKPQTQPAPSVLPSEPVAPAPISGAIPTKAEAQAGGLAQGLPETDPNILATTRRIEAQERFKQLEQELTDESEMEFFGFVDSIKRGLSGKSIIKGERDKKKIKALPARGRIADEMRFAKLKEFSDLQEELKGLPADKGELFQRMKRVGTSMVATLARTAFEITQAEDAGPITTTGADPASFGEARQVGLGVAPEEFSDSKFKKPTEEFLKAAAHNVALKAAKIPARPASGKFAQDIESLSDFFDVERIAVAAAEQAPQMAASMIALRLSPTAGTAFMFGLESGDALLEVRS